MRKHRVLSPGILFILLGLFLSPHVSLAQGSETTGPHQVGLFVGRLLPNGVTDDDEIMALNGLRYSMPSGKNNYYDFGGIFGNSENVMWQSLFTTLHMNIPVETLIGHAGVGVDVTRYGIGDEDPKNEIGFHFIGGMMSRIGGNSLFRFDMKLNSKPGTSLYFALGLVFELDGDSAKGD